MQVDPNPTRREYCPEHRAWSRPGEYICPAAATVYGGERWAQLTILQAFRRKAAADADARKIAAVFDVPVSMIAEDADAPRPRTYVDWSGREQEDGDIDADAPQIETVGAGSAYNDKPARWQCPCRNCDYLTW